MWANANHIKTRCCALLQSNEMHAGLPLGLLHPVHIHSTSKQPHKVKCKELVSQIALLAILYLGDRILSIPRPLLIFPTLPKTSFHVFPCKILHLSIHLVFHPYNREQISINNSQKIAPKLDENCLIRKPKSRPKKPNHHKVHLPSTRKGGKKEWRTAIIQSTTPEKQPKKKGKRLHQ